jgi:hypothetical protein
MKSEDKSLYMMPIMAPKQTVRHSETNSRGRVSALYFLVCTSTIRGASFSLRLALESICTNQETVLANVRNVKITSPDYKGVDPDKAVQDYMTRIRDHERYYEPVDEPDWPWIKIINV